MKELRRLRGETKDAFAEELLGSWRKDGPSASSRERAWAGLGAGVGAGAGLGGAGGAAGGPATHATAHAAAHATAGLAGGNAGSVAATSTAASSTTATVVAKAAAWSATSALKLLLLGAGASIAVATVAVAMRSPSRAGPVVPPQVAPAAPLATSPVTPHVTPRAATPGSAPSRPAELTEPTAIEAPVVVGPVHAAAPLNLAPALSASPAVIDGRQIGKQVASLDAARDALTAGDAPRALRLLDAYDADFPGGDLAQEATLVRVEALLAAGDRSQATALGRRFVEEHALSPYAAQVKQLLGNQN